MHINSGKKLQTCDKQAASLHLLLNTCLPVLKLDLSKLIVSEATKNRWFLYWNMSIFQYDEFKKNSLSPTLLEFFVVVC